ncbi:hypothetical protein PO909_006835 [Leuciscus waleckii]
MPGLKLNGALILCVLMLPFSRPSGQLLEALILSQLEAGEKGGGWGRNKKSGVCLALTTKILLKRILLFPSGCILLSGCFMCKYHSPQYQW